MALENQNFLMTDIKVEPPEKIEIKVEPFNFLDENIDIKTEDLEPEATCFVKIPNHHQVPYRFVQSSIPPALAMWVPPAPIIKLIEAPRTTLEPGKSLISSICLGHVALQLTKGWNAYFVKDPKRFQVLISQMSVKNGIPEMRKQMFINMQLDIQFYYGTRHLKHFNILHKRKVRTHLDIESIVCEFDRFKFCEGALKSLASLLRKECTFDKYIEKFRHRECKYVHNGPTDICRMCNDVIAKQRKLQKNYLLGAESKTRLHNQIRRLRNRNRQLKVDNGKLRRNLRKLRKRMEKIENPETS